MKSSSNCNLSKKTESKLQCDALTEKVRQVMFNKFFKTTPREDLKKLPAGLRQQKFS